MLLKYRRYVREGDMRRGKVASKGLAPRCLEVWDEEMRVLTVPDNMGISECDAVCCCWIDTGVHASHWRYVR